MELPLNKMIFKNASFMSWTGFGTEGFSFRRKLTYTYRHAFTAKIQ